MSSIHDTIHEILPEIIALRHELHQHPEIRFEEKWTSARVAAFLDTCGIPYKTGFARGTGIVATVQGVGPRTVALRADIDALEIEEETGLPYASRIPKRMHACGHDGHTAILCGVAKVLSRHLDQVTGSVKLVFQPAEEIAGGARYMVEDGAIDGVDAIFGLHGWPTLPLGAVGVKDGFMMASARDFHIEITGKGCHGADPAAGIDSIVVAAHVITALQTIVSRQINPWDSGVVTVAMLEAGQATNIIPERATLRGTIRWLDEAVGQRLRDRIETVAHGVARAFGAQASVTLGESYYPAVCNDPQAVDTLRGVVRDTLGAEAIKEIPVPSMGAEDFAYYLRKVPGAFFWLGVNPNANTPYPQLHNPHYDFNDEALPIGMTCMTAVAMRYLERGFSRQ